MDIRYVQVMDSSLRLPDGRSVGFATFGPADGVPVIHCHGAPGSRSQADPTQLRPARDLGLFMVGIDRPGYGTSTPLPGRTIADWVADGLAVAEHLGLETFYAAGISTGGAYALALAAMAPERVLGVVACCAMTDMRFEPARSRMDERGTRALWRAPDRTAAIAAAEATLGRDGRKARTGLRVACGLALMSPRLAAKVANLTPADAALLRDRHYVDQLLSGFDPPHGLAGYVDDRLADGPGWISFDIGHVKCPVRILHGTDDTIVNVINAHHTHALIPQSELDLREKHGHLSICAELPSALAALHEYL